MAVLLQMGASGPRDIRALLALQINSPARVMDYHGTSLITPLSIPPLDDTYGSFLIGLFIGLL